jgi:hypothetical protein
LSEEHSRVEGTESTSSRVLEVSENSKETKLLGTVREKER